MLDWACNAAGAALERAARVRGATKRLSILIYHGVSERPEENGHCDIDRRRFETHLDLLQRHYAVLPLGEAARRLRDGTLPANAASITFDDGYANNHSVALPLLERFGMQATFFVAVGYLDGGWMFNDVVIDAIRRSEMPAVDLEALGLPEFPLATPADRRRASSAIIGRLKYLPPAQREARAAAVRDACGVQAAPSLMMTSEQVRDLGARGMEVGGHTVAHPILNKVDDAVARREIGEGRRRLEEIVGVPVRVFAYPNGEPGVDYSARHVAMVREAAFDAAVSTSRACATPADDIFQLPRFTPWDRKAGRIRCRLAWSRVLNEGGARA